MENKCHSRTKKIQNPVKIFLPGNNPSSNDHLENLSQFIDKKTYASISPSASLADLTIESLDDSYLINITQKRFLQRSYRLAKNFNSLKFFLTIICRILPLKDKIDMFYSPDGKMLKIENSNLSRLKRINSHILKSNNSKSGNTQIKKIMSQKKEMDRLFNQCNTLEDLPRALLGLRPFKNYQTSQVLIHEKGNTTGENLHYNVTRGYIYDKIPIKNFNKIYSLIKKSKTKLFNQSQILEETLGVIGTFLAREINLKKHSIIIILSRNDLFPASIMEREFFNVLTHYLSPVFDELLEQYLSIKKSLHLALFLKNLPFPLTVIKNTEHIYVNDRGKIYFDGSDTVNKKKKIIPILNQYELILIDPDKETHTTDMYHFQRISLLGELLNTLQHELNNPLFGLKLTSKLLAEDMTKDDPKEMLNDITSSCHRCQNIIKNFSLLYYNKESFTVINLESILNEILVLTKSETRGLERKIKFSKNLCPKDWNIFVNPTWLTQIIFNFIINSAQAIKSMNVPLEHHKIIVNVNFFENDSRPISISVSDTGPGISTTVMDTLLNPFVTTKTHGTGLGLSICKYLAKKLDADMEFQNNSPFPGATFKLRLPYLEQ